MVHACNPSLWEEEVRGSEIKGHLCLCNESWPSWFSGDLVSKRSRKELILDSQNSSYTLLFLHSSRGKQRTIVLTLSLRSRRWAEGTVHMVCFVFCASFFFVHIMEHILIIFDSSDSYKPDQQGLEESAFCNHSVPCVPLYVCFCSTLTAVCRTLCHLAGDAPSWESTCPQCGRGWVPAPAAQKLTMNKAHVIKIHALLML